MIGFAILALAQVTPAGSSSAKPCVPASPDAARSPASALGSHRALRAALGESMPQAQTMVLLHGKGGHLATQEYSIAVVRSADGSWRGTAVGRTQIWIEGAPYEPMSKAEWMLGAIAARDLDRALDRTCKRMRARSAWPPPPPPRGFIYETMTIVRSGLPSVAFSVAEEEEGAIASLVRPPQ